MVGSLRKMPVISIVDDDESSLFGTLRLVRSLGFVAYPFSSGDAFLHSEQLNKTSCLISDIHMPGMNGIQLQDALREAGHAMPVIFITAFPDEKTRAQAFVRGAKCYLNKPFDGEMLSHCIK